MPEMLSCPQCGREFAEPADRCEIDGSPLYGPEVLARVGTQVGSYEVQGILGEGGMGVVYRGEHSLLGKPVAIKVLHERFARRKGSFDQFLKEARAATRIRHPNIVDITDFGTAPDGSVYFVMEYLEGESLETVLARQGVVDLFKAVNIVRQIARALAAAHDHGIVHQDLKPDNIFLINREGRRRVVRSVVNDGSKQFVVEPEGSFDFVKVLDFGVARFMQDKAPSGWTTKTGIIFGTPHYMSPEQARGEAVDGRSDVYALGILFYEMICGNVPFDSESALDILNGHVSGKVIPPGEYNPSVSVDEGTTNTIMKCLEKRPETRFQNMDELCEALNDCFTDRVFLRDAARLPGAVEAGIVPPPAPIRRAEDPSDEEREREPTTPTERVQAERKRDAHRAAMTSDMPSISSQNDGGDFRRGGQKTNPGMGSLRSPQAPITRTHSAVRITGKPRRPTAEISTGSFQRAKTDDDPQ